MRETIPIHDALTRWLPQAALVAAAIALTGCTMTPWTDSWQPARQPAPTSAATPGVIAGYYRVNPGDTLAGVANAYGSAGRGQLEPHGADRCRVSRCCASRRRLPRRRSGSHLRRPHSRSLAWPATGVVATPFSAGKTRGLVIAASADHSVRAAAAGRVVYAGSGVKAYGRS